MYMKKIRYLTLPLIITVLFFSACEKDGITEKELLEKLSESSLSIKISNSGTNEPISDAFVSIAASGKILTDTSDEKGFVFFEGLEQQSNAKLIVSKEGYWVYDNEINLEFSSRAAGEHVEIFLNDKDKATTIKGKVTIQTDLTTLDPEHPVGITIKALNQSREILAIAKTNNKGEYELKFPIGYGQYVYVEFPTLQYDQKLKVRDTSNTVVSTTANGTIFDPTKAAEPVPNTSNIIATVERPNSTVSGGNYYTASVKSLTVKGGVITDVIFGYLGQGYSSTKAIIINSLDGGSGANIRCSGKYNGYYNEPYYALNPSSLNILSGGTGYPDYEPNENVYTISPSGFKWDGYYYYYAYFIHKTNRYFSPGELYILDMDYGTGTTRGNIPVEYMEN